MEFGQECYCLGQHMNKIKNSLNSLLNKVTRDSWTRGDQSLKIFIDDCKTLLIHLEEKDLYINVNICKMNKDALYKVAKEVCDLENDYVNVYRDYVDYLKAIVV
jgi:hypothetical protein